MTQRRLLLAFTLIASSVGLACHREHLSSSYGQSYAAWFSAQHVNHPPANPEQARRIMEGLDAQEAAVVTKSYRRASQRGDEAEGRMLMISPNRGGEAAYIPPPSVPGGQ